MPDPRVRVLRNVLAQVTDYATYDHDTPAAVSWLSVPAQRPDREGHGEASRVQCRTSMKRRQRPRHSIRSINGVASPDRKRVLERTWVGFQHVFVSASTSFANVLFSSWAVPPEDDCGPIGQPRTGHARRFDSCGGVRYCACRLIAASDSAPHSPSPPPVRSSRYWPAPSPRAGRRPHAAPPSRRRVHLPRSRYPHPPRPRRSRPPPLPLLRRPCPRSCRRSLRERSS